MKWKGRKRNAKKEKLNKLVKYQWLKQNQVWYEKWEWCHHFRWRQKAGFQVENIVMQITGYQFSNHPKVTLNCIRKVGFFFLYSSLSLNTSKTSKNVWISFVGRVIIVREERREKELSGKQLTFSNAVTTITSTYSIDWMWHEHSSFQWIYIWYIYMNILIFDLKDL